MGLGADPNARDNYGRTPLHYAGNPDLLLSLAALGGDPYISDNEGETAFDAYREMLEKLEQEGGYPRGYAEKEVKRLEREARKRMLERAREDAR